MYAFTISTDRDITEFIGPFDTYEELEVCLNRMWYDDLTSVLIRDHVSHDRDYLKDCLDVKIYEVCPIVFSNQHFKDLCNGWEKNIKEFEEKKETYNEENERKQYEKLKEKFEGK